MISPHGGLAGAAAPHKRTRVLLSCAPCRASKLKCDRGQPCGQCLKKGRIQGCVYAPKPQRDKPPKSMAARLKRLEGMVRGMMAEGEGEGTGVFVARMRRNDAVVAAAAEVAEDNPPEKVSAQQHGQVVQDGKGTTYVGATHFMAMLDDIEDLKSYFEVPEEPDGESPTDESPDVQPTDLILGSHGALRSRQELLNLLPPRPIRDQLVMRYFSSNSPSQHVIHRPTFLGQYNEFCADLSKAPIEWLALLFMILGMGLFFAHFTAPHEVEGVFDVPPLELFQRFRAAAGTCVVAGKYTVPGPFTIQPFLLFLEAEFFLNRATQMDCYLLSAIMIRIMLKMGLHRDPSKLANISPFDGEMRRRMWNLATQLDLLVSIHMGLPSMIHEIPSDVSLPRNLSDDDFNPDCTELPPARPKDVYTPLSYPVSKGIICRVFGQVALHAQALTPPPYDEVRRLNTLLDDKWAEIPAFLKVRPLSDLLAEPAVQALQRFGVSSLYQKCRCVLHRRFLVEGGSCPEHERSRRICVEAALALLSYQAAIFEGTRPGGRMGQNGWFLTSLAMHDFLLAAVLIYLILLNDAYPGAKPSAGLNPGEEPTVISRDGLVQTLRQSLFIWIEVTKEAPEVKKAVDLLSTMLRKVDPTGPESLGAQLASENLAPAAASVTESFGVGSSAGPELLEGLTLDVGPTDQSYCYRPVPYESPIKQLVLSRRGLIPPMSYMPTIAYSWLPVDNNDVDWMSVDTALRSTMPTNETGTDERMDGFMDELQYYDFPMNMNEF